MLSFQYTTKNGEVITCYRIRKTNKYIKVDKSFTDKEEAIKFENLVLATEKVNKKNNHIIIENKKEYILKQIELTKELIILEDLYIQLYKECSSYQDFFNQLNLIYNSENFYKFKKIFKKHGFNDNKNRRHTPINYETEMFIENSPFTRGTVKRTILRLNLIKYQCAECSNPGHWNGKPLTLQIEHKNGLPNDHRLENLEFLCPNCHSQTDTYAARNKENSKINTVIAPKNELEKKLLDSFKNKNNQKYVQINKLDICKEYAISRGGECLSDIYINSVTKLEWKCHNPEHKSWLSNWEHTVKRNRWCPQCGVENVTKQNRLLINGLKKASDFVQSKNGELLSKEYINNHTPLEWKCHNSNHKPFTLLWSSINRGSWCPECKKEYNDSTLKSSSIENKDLTDKNKIILDRAKRYATTKSGKCLTNFIKKHHEILLWKCKEPLHNQFKGNYSFIVNDQNWCPQCNQN